MGLSGTSTASVLRGDHVPLVELLREFPTSFALVSNGEYCSLMSESLVIARVT